MIDVPVDVAIQRKKIVVVEDDPAVGSLLVDALQDERYHVWHATTGADGERLIDEVRPDLVILDIVLPDRDGLVLCAQLRSRSRVPLILLSGSQRQADRVIGLRLGADDFVAKPFEMDELEARIEAVLRRATASGEECGGAAPASANAHGSLVVDRARRQASVDGRPLPLTPTEFQLLALLSRRADGAFSRQELASALWGERDMSHSRAIDVHIRRLRQKLEHAPHAPTIATVWGYGYRLTVEPPD